MCKCCELPELPFLLFFVIFFFFFRAAVLFFVGLGLDRLDAVLIHLSAEGRPYSYQHDVRERVC